MVVSERESVRRCASGEVAMGEVAMAGARDQCDASMLHFAATALHCGEPREPAAEGGGTTGQPGQGGGPLPHPGRRSPFAFGTHATPAALGVPPAVHHSPVYLPLLDPESSLDSSLPPQQTPTSCPVPFLPSTPARNTCACASHRAWTSPSPLAHEALPHLGCVGPMCAR